MAERTTARGGGEPPFVLIWGATLTPGEILVAPSTDPGWAPLFLNAAGLGMAVGGRVTHGTLVAREYGLPAVASVGGETTERDGRADPCGRVRGTVDLFDRD
ncbi:MAG: PEP-utilizing enzyme [Salinigranum sp.]